MSCLKSAFPKVCMCVCVCMYVCVCVCVCVHARDHNFYSIDTTFGTLVGLVNSKVQKMGYIGLLVLGGTPRKKKI